MGTFAIQNASGEYLAPFDADLKNRSMEAVLTKNPTEVLVWTKNPAEALVGDEAKVREMAKKLTDAEGGVPIRVVNIAKGGCPPFPPF